MNRSNPEYSLGVLVSDVARLLRRNFDRRLQSLGLTQAQWRAIARISRSEGMSQAALAESLELQPITVARLIDRMENAGWIERRNDPLDRRAVQLYLTPKCGPILDEMYVRADETVAEGLAGLTAAAQKQLIQSLQRIKQNLIAAEPKAGAVADTPTRFKLDAGRKPSRLERRAR